MDDTASLNTRNGERYQMKVLTGTLFLVLSLLVYLVGLYHSRMEYPEFIANYPDSNFLGLIHPLIFAGAFLVLISIYLFASTRREFLLLVALILLSTYIWITNSLIVPNARVYDSYWHYSISQLIIDENQFSLQDITSKTFYLNYPFTGIFGAEVSIIMEIQKEYVVYYTPILISIILITFLYTTAGLFFRNSYYARAIVVMVFIIGNASLQTHFAPQTIGLISFAFLFYLMFKYSQKPELAIKVMMIVILFLTIVIHPLSSFIFGLVLVAYVFTFYTFKQISISSSMIMLFFIFFFAWQTYWAINTSTIFFRQLSWTATLIFTRGPLETGGTEYFVQPQYFDPLYFQFRSIVHGFFITLSILGWLVMMRSYRKKWIEISCFIAGPVLYFIFTYYSYSSFLYERLIMMAYFPLSIAVGFLISRPEPDSGDSELNKRMKFIDRLRLGRLVSVLTVKKRQIVSAIMVSCFVLATLSLPVFGLQEQYGVVPTQDINSSKFIADHDNGTILCFQSNAVIYFYDISSTIYDNPVHGWSYWKEAHLPAGERKVYYKPTIDHIILSKKYRDLGDDYYIIKQNLENDTTMNRIYDNGFIQIYS